MTSISKNRTVIDKIRSYFSEWRLPRGSRIVVACSGGPDSVTLLHALHSIRSDFNLHLVCAYLNHGLRDRSEVGKDIAFLENFTHRLRIPLNVGHLPEGSIARQSRFQHRSVEELARLNRYSYLKTLVYSLNADFVATGHTADDQVETVVMRFFSGSSIPGLGGIPPKRNNIIRPLLACSRKEILAYVAEHNLTYRLDSTNHDLRYLRNRIRWELLPVLKSVFPFFTQSVHETSDRMRRYSELLKETAQQRLVWQFHPDSNSYRIPFSEFYRVPGLIRLHSILEVFNSWKKGENTDSPPIRLPYRFLFPVLSENYLETRKTLLRGYGFRLVLKAEFLFFERDVVCPYKMGYLITVKNGGVYRVQGQDRSLMISVGDEGKCTAGTVSLKKWGLNPPVIIRSKRSGDRIAIKGGMKTIKKLFTEWKVPENIRAVVPLLCDRKGILAVLGEAMGFCDRYTPRMIEMTNASDMGIFPVAVREMASDTEKKHIG